MAQKRQRVGALIAAIIFLVSSLATSIGVIWLIVNDNGNNATSQTTNQKESEANPLIGTKLENFTPVASVPKLESIDEKVGDGAEATANSTLTVSYTGALTKDGTIFDASGAEPITFQLSGLIPGWQQGIPGMKVGGTRRLLIPAALAYGDQSPSPTIPPNSDLVFDITLLNVQ